MFLSHALKKGLVLSGALLGWGYISSSSDAWADSPCDDAVTTEVSEIQIYGSTFGLFEEPDDDLPGTVFDLEGNLYDGLVLTPPIATYTYSCSGSSAVHLVATSLSSKLMPYLLRPDPSQQPVQVPQVVYDALRSHLPGVSDADFAANTTAYPVAVGHFEEPDPSTVTAKLHGKHFEVTRDIAFTVNIQFILIYQPPGSDPSAATAVILPFLTNADVAAIFGIPPTPGIENDPVEYTWHSTMTLSTKTSFVRPVASEPTPLAIVFPPGLTTLDLSGSRIDHSGNYSIVGVAPATFTSSQAGILTIVFGSEAPDVTMVVQQTGVLSRGDD